MKIVVTGSSSGIGLETAKKFLAEGHDVVGIDIAPSRIEDAHYAHFVADIRKELPGIEGVEAIVLCAGTIEEEEAIDVNLVGSIKVAEKYAISPVLKSIVILASASARNGAEFPYYVASKGGMVTYMKNLAVRLAPRGVTVNSISPGAVVTPMNRHILNDPDKFKLVSEESLLKKWATPEEIADWVYFLAVVNKSMTGEDLLIDNGEMLKSNFIW